MGMSRWTNVLMWFGCWPFNKQQASCPCPFWVSGNFLLIFLPSTLPHTAPCTHSTSTRTFLYISTVQLCEVCMRASLSVLNSSSLKWRFKLRLLWNHLLKTKTKTSSSLKSLVFLPYEVSPSALWAVVGIAAIDRSCRPRGAFYSRLLELRGWSEPRKHERAIHTALKTAHSQSAAISKGRVPSSTESKLQKEERVEFIASKEEAK